MKPFGNSLLPALFLVFAALLQSCNSKPDRTGFMPPVKIKVPAEVKQDREVMKFVNSSEKVINELSDKMERAAIQGKDLFNKPEEDMTFMEKMKMTKLGLEFLSCSKSMYEELSEIQRYIERKQKEGAGKADMKAFEAVESTLEKRINDLNRKYNYITFNK